MSEVTWDAVREEFDPDDGSLKDVYVLDTTAEDWQRLLDLIRSRGWRYVYTEDGRAVRLPSAVEVLHVRSLRSTLLAFWPSATLRVHAHFFTPDQIEMDFEPKAVQDQDGLDGVVRFLRAVGGGLRRPVIVTWESSPDFVILRYSPSDDQVTPAL